MPILTPAEIRFQLKRGLQQIPRSVIQDFSGSDERRTRALDEAADILLARFNDLEVRRPDPGGS